MGTLYKLPPKSAYLPVLKEPNIYIGWSENAFKGGAILLRLRDFDLKEEHLDPKLPSVTGRHASGVTASVRSVALSGARTNEGYIEVRNRARKEFRETGKVEGVLFLAPNLQKVWLSHYDIELLQEVH